MTGEKETYQGESTVSTHAVASDTDAVGVQLRESTKDSLRQLLGNVAVHVVAVVIRGLGGIDVETGSGAEVICIILALDVEAAFQFKSVYRGLVNFEDRVMDDP